MRLVNFRTLIVGVGAVALAACGDDVTVNDPTTVQLTLSSATCTVGQQVQLLATVNGTNSSTTPVTYSVAPATGVVTLSGTTLTCAAPGSAIVTATAGNRTAQAAITVSPAPNPISSLQLVPDAFTINIGGTQTVTPIVTGNTGANTAVTFRSADPTIATVNATTGVVTGVRAGITTIIATSVASPNITAGAQVTVSASTVTSISATPSIVTLAPGGTISIVPNVQAPTGVSRAVTYTSNNTSVATVNASGVITAVGAGTAVISVASVADPSFTTNVAVTVAEPAPVRVTIQNVTFVNAQGNEVTANPDSITGTVSVTLNVDPGAQRLSRVEVLLGGVTVCSQSFSAAFAEALTMSELNGSADVQPITCTINTAQFDSLGVARNLNGRRLLQARVFTSATAGAPPTQTATIDRTLTLRNVNTFAATITTTPAANQVAQALDPAGRLWRAGAVVVRAFPVLYDSGTAASQLAVRIGDRGTRTATTRDASGAFVITFPGTSANTPAAPGSGSLTGYTTPTAISALQGDTVIVAGSVFGGGAGPVNNVLGFVRIDNQNPEASATFALNQNIATPVAGQLGSFINAGFNFDAAGIVTLNGGGGDNGGVDDIRAEFFAGDASTCTSAVNVVCSSFTRVRTGADLAPTIVSTTYRLQARLIDRLGNFRVVDLVNPLGNANAGNVLNFGIDISAPTLAFGGTNTGGASGTFIGANTGGQTFNVIGTDDLSGFGATPYQVSLTRLRTVPNTPTGVVTTECLNPNTFAIVAANAGVCPTFATNGTIVTPNVDGYYTYSAFVFDQAGNRSTATLTQRILVDAVAPSFQGVIATPAFITGASSVSFSANAQDNLDLITSTGFQSFPTIDLGLDSAAIGSTADNVLTTQATVTRTITSFIRQLEFTDATNNLVAGTAERPDQIALTVVDGAANAATTSSPLAAASIQTGTSFFAQPVENRIATFSVANTATTVDISGNATGTNVNTVTLRAVVTGPSQTLNLPFSRVEFRYLAADGTYRLLGTAGPAGIQDTGPVGAGTRTITYTFVLDPAAGLPTGAGNFTIRAFGISANGDALVTQPNTLVQLVP